MYSRGSCAPYTPLAEKISHPTRVFGFTYARVAFQLSSCNSFLDIKGSQMYSRGCCAPYTPRGGKNSYPKSLLDPPKCA